MSFFSGGCSCRCVSLCSLTMVRDPMSSARSTSLLSQLPQALARRLAIHTALLLCAPSYAVRPLCLFSALSSVLVYCVQRTACLLCPFSSYAAAVSHRRSQCYCLLSAAVCARRPSHRSPRSLRVPPLVPLLAYACSVCSSPSYPRAARQTPCHRLCPLHVAPACRVCARRRWSPYFVMPILTRVAV